MEISELLNYSILTINELVCCFVLHHFLDDGLIVLFLFCVIYTSFFCSGWSYLKRVEEKLRKFEMKKIIK